MIKKVLFVALFLSLALKKGVTQSLTGTYSYSFKPEGNPPKDEADNGPSGILSLIKIEGNKYRFWLDVTIGWPSYNIGQTDGTLTFKNDTASFDNSYEDADHPCILRFKRKGNIISINSQSTSFNCGFGHAVHADGDYTKDKKQPVMNYAWLKEQYSQSSFFIITAKKTFLYRDENALKPSPQGSYFVKGNKLINIDERQNTVYTEFITPAGKFLYGWIKKRDVKLLDFGE